MVEKIPTNTLNPHASFTLDAQSNQQPQIHTHTGRKLELTKNCPFLMTEVVQSNNFTEKINLDSFFSCFTQVLFSLK